MLALICGEGRLPAAIVAAAPGDVLVCELEGFAPEALEPDIRFRIETLGSLITDLKARGVTDICMAGAIRRPPVDPARIDAATMPLVPRLMQAIGAGDDGALRAVIAIFEDSGLRVRAAQEIAPDLLPPAGCATRVQPDKVAETDAARGARIVAAMGDVDVGQSCAVLKGQALAIEGIFGTDWMLQSLRARPDGAGGILYKAPKPGQDRRVDLPMIGPETVSAAHEAGLSGLVIAANGVMTLDRDALLAACDRLGLFLWVREAED